MSTDSTGPKAPPRFKVGDTVTVKATGRTGKVVHHTRQGGEWLTLVDQPHQHGILRQHYKEEEIE